jgi:hypothetical protein
MATVTSIKKDCRFLITMINRIQVIIANSQVANDLKGGLSYQQPTIQRNLTDPLSYNTSALNQEKITLSLQGFIAYIYVKAFNEQFPLNPTTQQISRISEIYDALNISVDQVINV